MVLSSPTPPVFDLTPTYGVLLIGVFFAIFFQGILTVQVHQYYQDFPDDPRVTKILVAVLWILDFIHLLLITYSLYWYLVTGWGNLFFLSRLIKPFLAHLLPLAFTSFLSQMFFLHRIWIFSQKNLYIVGPVFLCILCTFILIFVAGVLAVMGLPFPNSVVPMVLVGTITDIEIAALLCYYVLRRSEGTRDMKVTTALVTQVIRYTVATSALTSLLILTCLFTYLLLPYSFTFIALHFSSGRTYSNAVLVNLNARRNLRKTLRRIEPSFPISIELTRTSNAIQRLPRFAANSTQDQSSRVETTMSRSATDNIKLESIIRTPENTFPVNKRYSLP